MPGAKYANQAFSTLAAGITAVATSLSVAAGTGVKFPTLAGSGDYFLLTLSNASGFEIVKATARATDVITIVRAQEGTTAAAFSLGDVVEVRLTAGMMSDASAYGSMAWRNKLRNAKGEVAQRSTSVALAVTTTGYTLDGWRVTNTSSGSLTVTQQADVPSWADYQYSIRATVGTADAAVAIGDLVTLQQPIEGFLIKDMFGNPIALSVDVRSALTGTHCVSLRNAATTQSYVWTYSIAAANTWQNIVLLLPAGLTASGVWNTTNGTGAYLDFVLMAGTTFQSTSGSWLASNSLATSAQVNVMATAANVFAIGFPQLERNSAPSVHDHVPYEMELIRCQRYLPAFQATGTVDDFASGGTTSTSAGLLLYPFLVEPRIAPTGIVISSAAHFTLTTMAAQSAVTALTFSQASKRMCRLSVTGTGTPYAANQPAFLLANNVAGSILFTGPELT